MPTRTRSRVLSRVTAGTVNLHDPSGNVIAYVLVGGSGNSGFQTCDDSTQPRPYVNDQPLTIVKQSVEPLKVNGTQPWVFTGYTWNWTDYNPVNRSLASYCPSVTPQNNAYWMTKALANMNPSRPIVDLPLFLFELREFPRMLKHLGDLLNRLNGRRPRASDVSDAHLAYSFGWAPLVSDLLTLCDFAREMEKRKAYLKALESGKAVKRTLFKGPLAQSTTQDGYTIALVTAADVIADVVATENLKVWFTANAKLKTELPDGSILDPDEIFRQALGLYPSAHTLWNMFPWTWLIDYFVNIGDFLQANRGFYSYYPTRMNLMYTQTAESTLTRVRTAPGLTAQGFKMKIEVKNRIVYANPTPLLAWDPFLSGHQIAIMSSLITSAALGSKFAANWAGPLRG